MTVCGNFFITSNQSKVLYLCIVNWTDDILKNIEQFGSMGFSTFRIANELNMTPAELRDERAKDKTLDEAVQRAEYGYEQYLIDKYEENSINEKSPIQFEAYKRLKDKHNSGNDNEIIIRRV